MLPLGEDYEGKRRRPIQTYALVTVILLLGLATGPGNDDLRRALTVIFGLIPSRLQSDPASFWHTLLTYQFLHGSALHMATNLLFLWVFGKGLEHELRGWYLPFFLLTGVAAGQASVWARAGSDIPTIGASGAISGILGAYLILLPHASIRAFVMLPWFWVAALLRGDKPVWDVPAWTAIAT